MALSRDLMIGMLRRGATGDQLMQILDLIVSDLGSEAQETAQVESEDIQFWTNLESVSYTS